MILYICFKFGTYSTSKLEKKRLIARLNTRVIKGVPKRSRSVARGSTKTSLTVQSLLAVDFPIFSSPCIILNYIRSSKTFRLSGRREGTRRSTGQFSPSTTFLTITTPTSNLGYSESIKRYVCFFFENYFSVFISEKRIIHFSALNRFRLKRFNCEKLL